jgi:hypothetical protein
MPVDTPAPPPPGVEQHESQKPRGDAPIADVREQFARKNPQSPEDEARARAFVDGKIEMIRRDPHMTEAEKAAAIAGLEARR